MVFVIAWLIVGLVAGALARLFVPGRDPMGLGGTLVLGLVGSLIGGFLGWLLFHQGSGFSPAGLIGSIIGAVIALLVYRAMQRRGTMRDTGRSRRRVW
jgi:uncharacterized membrane protein YeaQ/YmgE (transglycosylase-associated protein family)